MKLLLSIIAAAYRNGVSASTCAPDSWTDAYTNSCADYGMYDYCKTLDSTEARVDWMKVPVDGYTGKDCKACGCVEAAAPKAVSVATPCNPNAATWYDWEDMACPDYARNNLCTIDGDYGTGWTGWYTGQTFATFTTDGFDALSCPECGCGDAEADVAEVSVATPCNPNAATFSDDAGLTCYNYEEFNLCTIDGDYGKGWDGPYDGETFASVVSSGLSGGYDGRSCPECGCGDAGADAAEGSEEGSVATPCPSTECWTYDEDTHTCSMSGTCATLSCDSTQFDITFSSELFNLDTESPATFDHFLSPTWNGEMWSLTTLLGNSGMTYELSAEKHDITFSLPLTIVGSEMKTRSDDTIQDNLIVLGSQSVVTTPFGASIVFTCSYDLTVEVASEEYTVAGASVVDTFTGTGSLSAGFAMSLNNGEGSAFLLGDNIQVGITWAVTTLSDLTYRIKQCDVQHGDSVITIVKDQCYATALDVVPDDHMDQGFSYQIFKGVDETDESQQITCTVIICETNKYCGPYSNSECPNDGDDVYYKFQMNPANDG